VELVCCSGFLERGIVELDGELLDHLDAEYVGQVGGSLDVAVDGWWSDAEVCYQCRSHLVTDAVDGWS